MKRLLTLLFLLSVSASLAGAQDLDRGLEAYENGEPARALELMLPLAEQGNVEAQYYVAELYADDRSDLYDEIAATKWTKAAAEQGLASAQLLMGFAYKIGNGVPQDYVLAYMWFNLAGGAKKWLTRTPEKRRTGMLKMAQNQRESTAQIFMSHAEIKEAQRRTRAWLDTHPQ